MHPPPIKSMSIAAYSMGELSLLSSLKQRIEGEKVKMLCKYLMIQRRYHRRVRCHMPELPPLRYRMKPIANAMFMVMINIGNRRRRGTLPY